MDDVLLPLLIFGTPERRRAELTEQILPAAVPGTLSQRVAFAAVVAQQQISIREQKELRIVKEAAARYHDAEDLTDNAPTIHAIYAALPQDVQATIEFGTWADRPDRFSGSQMEHDADHDEETVGAGAGRAK